MLHTYKFIGDPNILNQRQDKTLSVITTKNHVDRLLKDHPLLEPFEEKGQFVMLKLSKQ